MRFDIAILLINIAILIFATAGCAPKNEKSNISSFVDVVQDAWSSTKISVCFEDGQFDIEKKTIELAVTKEFEKIGFDFFGWTSCQGSESVRVQFQPKSGISQTLRISDEGTPRKFRISFGLAHGCAPGIPFSGSNCQASIAVHEFGHILGLHHEMNRRDNPSCDQEQLDQIGDRSAIQIGDFDEESIMNYCSLAESAIRNEYRGLSILDRVAIRSLYDFPIASLSEFIPVVTNRSEFKAHLAGSPTSQYQYAVGVFGEIDCKQESVYKNATEVLASEIFEGLPLGRTLRLCLVAGVEQDFDDQVRWQPLDVYSSIDFALLDPTDKEAPILKSVSLIKSPTRPNYFKLTVESDDKSEIANISADFGYMQHPFQVKFPKLKTIVSIDPNVRALEIPISAFIATGTTFLRKLTLTDRNGNTQTWQTDISSMLLAPGIQSPAAAIKGKYSYEVNSPTIEALKFESDKILKDKPLVLEIQAKEESGIKNINLFVVNTESKKVKLISSIKTWKREPDGNNFTAEFDLSAWTETGNFRIQSISIYDSFDNVTKLKSSSVVQENFDGISLKVPSFTIESQLAL